MDLPEREVISEPEEHLSCSPPCPSPPELREDHNSVSAIDSENGRSENVPASGTSDDDEFDPGYDSIFALRVPPTMDGLPAVSEAHESPLHSTISKTLPATILTIRYRSDVDTTAKAQGPAVPRESEESGSDDSDTMSDVSSLTDSSLIENFRPSAVPLSPQIISVLIRMKDQIEDRIRSRLHLAKAHPQGTRQCPAGSSSGCGSSASGSLSGGWGSARNLGGYDCFPMKPARGNDGHDSDAEDSDGENRNERSAAGLTGDRPKRFACVFFKRYPNSKELKGVCRNSGWDSMHRLKEHIYRVHRFHCPRCRQAFPSQKKLESHLQQPVACELSASMGEEEILFINRQQERKLRRRPRKGNAEDRWIDVFQLVFPNISQEQTPSPYHDHITTLPSDHLATLQSFQTYLLNELPRRISRAVASHPTDGSTIELFHREIRKLGSEFISSIRFVSSSSNESGTVAMPESQAGSDELRLLGDTGSSPVLSFYHPSITPSDQPVPFSFGVDNNSAQWSCSHGQWPMCGCQATFYSILNNSQPLTSFMPPLQPPAVHSNDGEWEFSMVSTSESIRQ